MRLYDLYTKDGKYVDTLTRSEIMKKFGLTDCRFHTVLNNAYLLDGKYWIDDSAEDIKVRRIKDRDLFVEFNFLTRKIRRAVGWES